MRVSMWRLRGHLRRHGSRHWSSVRIWRVGRWHGLLCHGRMVLRRHWYGLRVRRHMLWMNRLLLRIAGRIGLREPGVGRCPSRHHIVVMGRRWLLRRHSRLLCGTRHILLRHAGVAIRTLSLGQLRCVHLRPVLCRRRLGSGLVVRLRDGNRGWSPRVNVGLRPDRCLRLVVRCIRDGAG